MRIKIRKTWGGFNPRTRVKDSIKKYSRQKQKKETREITDDTPEKD